MKKPKTAYRKDIFRTIKNGKKRFISILVIVALGVIMSSGLRASCVDLRLSADAFMDEQQLYDIVIQSTLGLTDDDVSALASLSEVEAAAGGYSETVYLQGETHESVLIKTIIPSGMNSPYLVEGTLPEAADEIAVTQEYLENSGKEIGDTLSIEEIEDEDEDDEEEDTDSDDSADASSEEASGTDADDKTVSGDAAEDTDSDSSEEGSSDDEDDDSTFYYTEFVITAVVQDPADINNPDSSTSFRDTSTTDYTFFVAQSAVNSEIYTAIYITVAGAAQLNCYSDDYEELIASVVDDIEAEIKSDREQARTDEVLKEAEEEIAEAESEMNEAFEEADEEIAEAESELEDAREQLDEGWEEYYDGLEEIESAQAELEDGEEELESEQESALAQIAEAKAALEESRAQLDEAWAELEENEALLEENRSQVEDGISQLESALSQLEEAAAQLESALSLYAAALTGTYDSQTLAQQETASEGSASEENSYSDSSEDAAGEANSSSGSASASDADSYAQALAQYEELYAQYEEITAQIASLQLQLASLEESLAVLEAAEAELESGRAELESAQAELESGEAELSAQEAEASEQFAQAWAQINESKATLSEAIAELEEGLSELEEGEEEYAQGLAEFEESVSEYEEEKADAEAEIADAREQLADIDTASWYVQDRSSLSGFSNVDSDSGAIEAIGNYFPIIFLAVAVLISLTTITRMVDEERGLIGTYKALGFTDAEIRRKYIIYSLAACLAGSIIGELGGFIGLPAFVFIIFKVMYSLPAYRFSFDLLYGLLGPVIFFIGVGFATWFACRRALMQKPAVLMRPKAPRAGSRVFLEYITFIWKRLSFLNKVTARNLFRYKKRLAMTIVGIAGCTGLLLFGFAIKDSVADFVVRQYGDIYQYDLMAVATDNDDLLEYIDGEEDITDYISVLVDSVTVEYDSSRTSVQLIVVPDEDSQDFAGYISLYSTSSKSLELESGDVYITLNAGTILGFTDGDTVTMQDLTLAGGEAEITSLVLNYLGNCVYMTSSTYEEIFEEEFEANAVLANFSDSVEDAETWAEELSHDESITSAVTVEQLEGEFDSAFILLTMVVYIIIVMAALLAFVVLFTLSTTNISEREREIATIKVLGFHDREVHTYVNKEMILLTVIGIIPGLVLGYFLSQGMTPILKMPGLYFAVSIHPVSYVFSVVLTLVFAVLVQFITNKVLNKVDPVEALKSIE